MSKCDYVGCTAQAVVTWQRTDPEDERAAETETVRTCAAHPMAERFGWRRA